MSFYYQYSYYKIVNYKRLIRLLIISFYVKARISQLTVSCDLGQPAGRRWFREGLDSPNECTDA